MDSELDNRIDDEDFDEEMELKQFLVIVVGFMSNGDLYQQVIHIDACDDEDAIYWGMEDFDINYPNRTINMITTCELGDNVVYTSRTGNWVV